jgi:hypothetical protein
MRAAVVVGIAVLAVSPAAAQQSPACMPVDEVQKILRENYREAPVLTARIDNGNMLVIFASEDGSWTAVLVAPTGLACVGPMGVALRFTGKGA